MKLEAAAALLAILVGFATLHRQGPWLTDSLGLSTLREPPLWRPELLLTSQPLPTPRSRAPASAIPAGVVPCVDLSTDCAAWQRIGECESNPGFMHANCAAACGSCANPEFAQARASAAAAALAKQQQPQCKDKAGECAFWAQHGECDSNPGFMKLSCPVSCDSCEWADFSKRCRYDPDAQLAVPPGAIGALFTSIDEGAFAQYKPRIVSRPPQPWVAIFDEFISEAHADEIVAVANSSQGGLFTPSQGTGGLDEHGQLIPTLSSYRTSSTRWCEGGCLNESALIDLRERVVSTTATPDANHEYPQLLRYHPSQYYKEHSDYIPAHKDMPCGPRVYTLFVYLSDVEEGGHTSFPQLGLSVKPKKGRAVLWPSVHDGRPTDVDERTMHIANPVVQGTKFSVNFWIHQLNFKANHAIGCTG